MRGVYFDGEKFSVSLVSVKKLLHVVETLFSQVLFEEALSTHAVRPSSEPKTMGILLGHVVIITAKIMHQMIRILPVIELGHIARAYTVKKQTYLVRLSLRYCIRQKSAQ